MAARHVAVVVGSLRRESLNRRMARALAGVMPDRLALDEVPIGELPLYNADLDGDPPPPWRHSGTACAQPPPCCS